MTDRERRRSRRGGRTVPRHPAAVSGPGALSQRTDGGPADLVNPSEGTFGQRKALLDQRAAVGGVGGPIKSLAPDAVFSPPGGAGGTSAAPSSPPGGGASPQPDDPLFAQDVFGRQTERPREPLTAGAQTTRVLPPDADALLRLMFRRSRDPRLLRLLLR